MASRRVVDEFRSQESRRRREDAVAALEPDDRRVAPPADSEPRTDEDDALTLLYLCCHPSLTESSQIALTLRAVGGLTTAEIARAFLVPERTLGQRIGRAKQRIAESGGTFELPPPSERAERLRTVLHVLYLIFNEGYTATRARICSAATSPREAIRLTRQLHAILPEDGEVAGLLALMLLTDARRPARTGADGSLIPLAEQDRARWSSDQIREGVALVTGALSTAALGTYQLQAAIAALHDEAARAEDTDWPQILALYELLDRTDPSPVVTLNRSVAMAMVRGPEAGLRLLATLDADERMTTHHRVRRRARAPARARRRPAGRARGLPGGRAADDEHARAALPRGPRRPPRVELVL